MNVLSSTVVFDTNAYRQFVLGLDVAASQQSARALRAREQRSGVRAVANPYVILELLLHLSDPSDPAHENCLSAVFALALHCQLEQHPGRIVIMGDVESHLTRGLYGVSLPDHDQVTEAIARICSSVQLNPHPEYISQISPQLFEIKDFIRKAKGEFVGDMFSSVVQGLNPEATDWNPLKKDPELRAAMLQYLHTDDALHDLARALVLRAKIQAGMADVYDEHVEGKVALVTTSFNAPLRLYRSILRRIVMTGCDLSKNSRSNWLWDVYVLFGAGNTMEGLPVRLVTDDKDIWAAAEEAAIQDAVTSLSVYLARLAS